MRRKNSINIKPIYSVLMLLLVAFIVIKGSTITSLASGDGKTTPCTTMEDTVRAVRAGLMARQSHIEVRAVVPQEYRSNLSQFLSDVYDATLVHDPSTPNGGDYLESNRGACSMDIDRDKIDLDDLTIIYDTPACGEKYGYLSTPEQETETLTTLDAAVASLKLSSYSTDYDKVKAIYDYVRLNVTYDKSLTDHSTYSAAVKRKSVCQGYSSMFYYMMLKAGLDCRIITGYGNGGRHAWNIVKIHDETLGDLWYNVDVTWDSDIGSDRYFLLSDATFNSTTYGGGHERDDVFASEDFYKSYPMTTVDNPFKDDGNLVANLYGCNAICQDAIVLQCWLDATTWATDEDKSATGNLVEFDIPSTSGYKQTLSYADRSGTGTHGGKPAVVFSYSVPVRCMSEVVTLQVVSGSDPNKKSEVFRVSVKKYVDVLMENPDTNPGYVDLLKSLCIYGAYAQDYFNMKPPVAADAGIALADNPIKNDIYNVAKVKGYIEKGVTTADVPNVQLPNKLMYGFYTADPKPYISTDENITYYGTCLVLRSQTVIRHYFKLSNGATLNDYTFTFRGTDTTVYEQGEYVCVETTGWAPDVLYDTNVGGNTIRVKKNATNTNVIVFQYNPMDYVHQAFVTDGLKDDTKLTNMLLGMWWYSMNAFRL